MREACVVGAGVIGVTTAWYLLEAGWKVTLLDRVGAAGYGASFQNGGQLSYRYVSPLADSGVPLKALRWLMQPDGPLRFKPQADKSQWVWLARFLARCNRRANRKMTDRLAQLGEYSRRCLHDLMARERLAPFGWREAGKLIVHRDRSTFARACRAMPELPHRRILTPAQCSELEPAIDRMAAESCGGILDASEAVADCHAFCSSMLGRLASHPHFLGLVGDDVVRIDAASSERVELRTSEGRRGADAVVIANGIDSRKLMQASGLPVTIYPLKGYSLDVPIDRRHLAPRISITDFERKVVYARLGDRLRVAAMVDLVGEDRDLDPHRLDSLLRIVRTDMPGAGDYDRAQAWSGLRPATPDGAPLIGPGSLPGLWLNIGHGGLGFTFACGSAALLARKMTTSHQTSLDPGFTWPSP